MTVRRTVGFSAPVLKTVASGAGPDSGWMSAPGLPYGADAVLRTSYPPLGDSGARARLVKVASSFIWTDGQNVVASSEVPSAFYRVYAGVAESPTMDIGFVELACGAFGGCSEPNAFVPEGTNVGVLAIWDEILDAVGTPRVVALGGVDLTFEIDD